MGGPNIKEAMNIMYRSILDDYNGEVDRTGLLLFVLASVIYHSPWPKSIITRKPGHPSYLIPLLNNPELLKILQLKIDFKEGDQVSRVIWIPPRIENACICSKIFTLCNEILIQVKALTTLVRDAVSQMYEEKAVKN